MYKKGQRQPAVPALGRCFSEAVPCISLGRCSGEGRRVHGLLITASGGAFPVPGPQVRGVGAGLGWHLSPGYSLRGPPAAQAPGGLSKTPGLRNRHL